MSDLNGGLHESGAPSATLRRGYGIPNRSLAV